MLVLSRAKSSIIEADMVTIGFKDDEQEHLIRYQLKVHSLSGNWEYNEIMKMKLNDQNKAKVYDIRKAIFAIVEHYHDQHDGRIDVDKIRENVYQAMKVKL